MKYQRQPKSFLLTLSFIFFTVFTIQTSQARTITYPRLTTIFEKPFDKVLCLGEYKGTVYAGVGHGATAKIYRLNHSGCKIWEEVTPLWRTDTVGDHMAMVVFKNALFVGTGAGEVFATIDGLKWYPFTGALPNRSISDMEVFIDHLYISYASGGIFRSADGFHWSPVIGSGAGTADLGGSEAWDLLSIEPFGGYLYAGVGIKSSTTHGFQLWRTADGIHWSLFQEERSSDVFMIGNVSEHVYAMTQFNGYLYVGEYHGNSVYRTDGSEGSWEHLYSNIESNGIRRLIEHDGKIYRGNFDYKHPNWLGDKLLFESSDASTWTAVTGSPSVTSDGAMGIGDLLSANGKLYAGTINTIQLQINPTHMAQIYEMRDQPETCSITDMNNLIEGLRLRIQNMIDLVSQCNPPPADASSPPSSCFLAFGGYGQAVMPDSPDWSYSPVQEIADTLERMSFSDFEDRVVAWKKTLLTQINTEFKAAMELIMIATLTIDSQGETAVEPLLDEAVNRLNTVDDLLISASTYSTEAPVYKPPVWSFHTKRR